MNEVNILVVEDDEEINNLIARCLKKEGYNVYQAFDGREALIKYEQKDYQMIVLDLMLPYIDGMEIMRRIRENSTVPILVLSAKDEETDKIIGLGLGADDYMTKPFSSAELLARVKAQLRRFVYFNKVTKEEKNEIIIHGNLKVDLENYVVLKGNENVVLTAKEFEILKLFLTHPNRVFTKSQIFSHVWGEEFMSDENTVMVHMRRLRTKIEDDPSNPNLIQTVWGIGYKLGEIK